MASHVPMFRALCRTWLLVAAVSCFGCDKPLPSMGKQDADASRLADATTAPGLDADPAADAWDVDASVDGQASPPDATFDGPVPDSAVPGNDSTCGLDISADPNADAGPLAVSKAWDADLPGCLPAVVPAPLPLVATATGSCMAAGLASQLAFDDSGPNSIFYVTYQWADHHFHGFANGSMMLCTNDKVLTVSADAAAAVPFSFAKPFDAQCGADVWLVGAVDGSAAAVLNGSRMLVIAWMDENGVKEAEATVLSPLDEHYRFQLAKDGTLYATGKAGSGYGVIAIAKGGAMLWQRATPGRADIELADGGGLLAAMSDGPGFRTASDVISVYALDGAGAPTARISLPKYFYLEGTDGQGGMYLTSPGVNVSAKTGDGDYQDCCVSGWSGFVLMRTDACGKPVWSAPWHVPISLWITSSLYGLLQLSDLESLPVRLRKIPGGLAVMTFGHGVQDSDASGYIARWTHDGRRLADIRYDQATGEPAHDLFDLTSATLPGGGYAIATPKGIYRTNAAGSTTCKGCGAGAPSCDDKDPCTTDACAASLGDCSHVAVPGCKEALGTCITDADCDDGEPCTADSCDKGTGACGHAQQATCELGNRCLGRFKASPPAKGYVNTGTCVAGVCKAPASTADAVYPSQLPTTGWMAGLDTARPQVHETAEGGLHVAGDWYAVRYQADGVVRWRHQQPGRIEASAPAAGDGLLLALTQPPGQIEAGKTRLVRLSKQGQVVSDKLVATGLGEAAFEEPWEERKRWLLATPTGGHVLVATLGWTATAWQGRFVTLSQVDTVTASVDVQVDGIGPGTVPQLRGIDQVWLADGGGVLLAWHRHVQAGARQWGAARLGMDGKLAWSQLLIGGPMLAAGFDPWRPRALVLRAKPAAWQTLVALEATGPAVALPAAVTDVGEGVASASVPAAGNVLAFAELPGVHAFSASYAFSPGNAPTGVNASTFAYPVTLPARILQRWLALHGHAISDLHVMKDGRIVAVASHPPGRYLHPALLVLDQAERVKPCGKHPAQVGCKPAPWYCFGF